MRKEILIGGQTIELEANLGTASFFQEFTGKNIFNISSEIAAKMSEAAKKTAQNKEIMNDKNKLKLELLESGITEAVTEAVDVAKALTYIMNLQTKYGKTKEDIGKIRSELTKDDLLAWEMNFSPDSFSFDTYTKLMSFWKRQTEATSEEKN